MAKIFVSYTGKDGAEAAWIARELRRLHHTPFLHEEEVKGGESFMAWMGRRMEESDHALCLMSPEYFTAEFSQREYNAALTEATRKGSNFLLPVIVRPCDVPKLVADLNRCTLHDVVGEEKRARFDAFINRSTTPDRASGPAAKLGAALSNIPIRVPTHFMGREASLEEIAAALEKRQGRAAITALHGLRGVGKTVLAAAFAQEHAKDYRATWWIRSETEATMRADLVGLGVRVGWVASNAAEPEAVAAVLDQLAQAGEGILLIYDNAVSADAIYPFLPRGGAARALITSNAHVWRSIATPIRLDIWPEEVGADFLIARTGRTGEREAALELSELLGGLPLAHEQAAAYCERLGISIAEYVHRFVAEPAHLLDDSKDAPADYHPEYFAENKDRLTVAKTFALAIEAAAKLHPAAELLIAYCALLAPEPIPLFLFKQGCDALPARTALHLRHDGLDEALATLSAFGLVYRESYVDHRYPSVVVETIRLHRLVREIARQQWRGAALEEALVMLVQAMAKAHPDERSTNIEDLVKSAILVSHVGYVQPKDGTRIQLELLKNSSILMAHRISGMLDTQDVSSATLSFNTEKILGLSIVLQNMKPSDKNTKDMVQSLKRNTRNLCDKVLRRSKDLRGIEDKRAKRVLRQCLKILSDVVEN